MDEPVPASRNRARPHWFAAALLVVAATAPSTASAARVHNTTLTSAAVARPLPKVVVASVAVAAPTTRLAAAPTVRCDACVASAQTARFGEPSIQKRVDVNAWTTVQVGPASLLRLTSLQPVSLLFRTRF
jgi:hypothetical protein